MKTEECGTYTIKPPIFKLKADICETCTLYSLYNNCEDLVFSLQILNTNTNWPLFDKLTVHENHNLSDFYDIIHDIIDRYEQFEISDDHVIIDVMDIPQPEEGETVNYELFDSRSSWPNDLDLKITGMKNDKLRIKIK